MGYVLGMSREFVKHDRLCANRLCVDVQEENVHLHYRDLRIEMSIREWEVFSKFITQVSEPVKFANKDSEFKQFYETLPDKNSDFFPNRISVESDGKGLYHIHYHEIRLEFDTNIFKVFCGLINVLNSGNFQRIKLKDLLAYALTDSNNEKRFYISLPIEGILRYKALVNRDQQFYDLFRVLTLGITPNAKFATWEEFCGLYQKIKSDGFDFSYEDKITINEKNIITDGCKRVCILYSIYGPECELFFYNFKAYSMVEEHP